MMGVPKNLLRLHHFIYTLVYPAVLGAMIVYIIRNYQVPPSSEIENLNIQYAIFLAIYFSSQHVQNVISPIDYSIAKYITDIFEIIFMYFLFLFLGIVDPMYKIGGDNEKLRLCFYLTMASVFFLPVVARMRDNNCNPFSTCQHTIFSVLSIGATLISFLTAFIHIDLIALIALSVLLVVYIYYVFHFDKENNIECPV